jgi:hypothetical protein
LRQKKGAKTGHGAFVWARDVSSWNLLEEGGAHEDGGNGLFA